MASTDDLQARLEESPPVNEDVPGPLPNVPFTALCHHNNNCLREAARVFVRCFVIGTLTKATMNVIKLILSRGKSRKLSNLLDVSFGLFLGSTSAVMKGVTCLLRIIRKKEDGWNSVIAGLASSLCLNLADPDDRQTISLYTFVRSLECVIRTWCNKGVFPSWMSSFQHWDVVLMCATAREILCALFYRENLIDPTYYRFLKVQGNVDDAVVNGIKAGLSQIPPNVEELSRLCAKHKMPFEKLWLPDGHLNICSVQHPNTTCVPYFAWFFVTGLRRAASVYLPVHALYALMLVARSNRRIHVMAKIFWRFLQNVFWSCSFLSLYVTLALGIGCFLVRLFDIRSLRPLQWTMWIPGLAVLLDHKSRRLELGLYCLPKAMETWWAWHMRTHLPHGHLFLFALGMAGLSHSYQRHSERSIRPSIRAALKWLWGPKH